MGTTRFTLLALSMLFNSALTLTVHRSLAVDSAINSDETIGAPQPADSKVTAKEWHMRVRGYRKLHAKLTAQKGNLSKAVRDGQADPENDGYNFATLTTYWDCSYQHCATHMSKLKTEEGKCHIKDDMSAVNDENRDASWRAGFFIEDGQLFGTAAVSSTFKVGGQKLEENEGCGLCYHIINPKNAPWETMTLMATNWCPECAEGRDEGVGGHMGYFHFDVAVPGGGEGYAPNCMKQYPSAQHHAWGAAWIEMCDLLPHEQLQESCRVWHWKFGNDAGWQPEAAFKQVPCPAQLTKRIGCNK